MEENVINTLQYLDSRIRFLVKALDETNDRVEQLEKEIRRIKNA